MFSTNPLKIVVFSPLAIKYSKKMVATFLQFVKDMLKISEGGKRMIH